MSLRYGLEFVIKSTILILVICIVESFLKYIILEYFFFEIIKRLYIYTMVLFCYYGNLFVLNF